MVLSPAANRRNSLAPYLPGEGSVAHPTLSLIPLLPGYEDRAYPFQVLDDSDATSALIQGSFVTDTGNPLRRVLLRIQKDQYSFRESDLGAVTNEDVDAAWPAMFPPRYASHDGENGLLLAAQITLEGEPARLSSLFFCREKRLFFQPLCPTCGSPLALCTDDSLLRRNGLNPYSTSLRRYLHCPSCCNDGLQEFYLYERESTDPVTIKDRWALIDRFRFITPSLAGGEPFPCVGCDLHESCYGPSQSARLRIAPFSFYPFYLLIHDEPALHAQDFLRLISGAEVKEAVSRLNPVRQTGRVSLLTSLRRQELLSRWCSQRTFLDLLQLKLSFLGRVVERLLRSGFPVERLKGENIWLRFLSDESDLPSLRDVAVMILPDTASPSLRGVVDRGGASCYAVGLFWLQTLSANSTLGEGDISSVVARSRNRRPTGASQPTPATDLLFAPENIFWNPHEATVPKELVYLWEKALSLGVNLVESSFVGSFAPLGEGLRSEIASLSAEIERARYAGSPPSPQVPPAPDVNQGRMVLGVLSRLLDECRREAAPQGKAVPEDETDEETATVIITPRRREVMAPPPREDDFVTETVVLSADMVARGGVIRRSEPPPIDLLDETIVIPRRATVAALPPGAGSSGAEGNDDLEETVCFRPERRNAAPVNQTTVGDVPPVAPSPPVKTEEDDLLGETIVIMPRRSPPRPGGRQ